MYQRGFSIILLAVVIGAAVLTQPDLQSLSGEDGLKLFFGGILTGIVLAAGFGKLRSPPRM